MQEGALEFPIDAPGGSIGLFGLLDTGSPDDGMKFDRKHDAHRGPFADSMIHPLPRMHGTAHSGSGTIGLEAHLGVCISVKAKSQKLEPLPQHLLRHHYQPSTRRGGDGAFRMNT